MSRHCKTVRSEWAFWFTDKTTASLLKTTLIITFIVGFYSVRPILPVVTALREEKELRSKEQEGIVWRGILITAHDQGSDKNVVDRTENILEKN